ncbi:MAG: LysE/ArgO family amino acid transporter [Pseudonocardiaceae bacterium]
MTAYLSGLMLGFALIVPIGPQNIVVLNQGLTIRFPKSLFAAVFAGLCDTLLIVTGAVGVGALLAGIPALRSLLLAVGAVFLLYLALGSCRRSTTDMPAVGEGCALPQVAAKIAGASLLNPHAILDTVVVIGATIAAQRDDVRLLFAGGTLSASWLWFAFLVLAAGAIRRYLTPSSRAWLDRVSGATLVLFAGMLALECAHSVMTGR